MFKRFTIHAIALSAFLFTMVSLLPAAGTAQAQVEPQQGAINTTRSNIKNTSRTDLQSQLHNLKIEVAGYRGQVSESGSVSYRVHEIDNAGQFNLGVLQAGRYELRVTHAWDLDGDIRDTSSKKATQEAPPPSPVTITLDGVNGGSVQKVLALTSSSGDAATTARLDGRIDSLDDKVSSEAARTYGPGKPVYSHIFEADGRSEVKGTVRHGMLKSIIGNMRP